ncbi:MAG: hypothetical protein IPK16_04310 [Anaerolineales bacterium]|nr:hypothetical protein [Anaerolineales bacterium]
MAAGSTHQIHDLKLDRVRAGAPQLAALFKNLTGPQGNVVVCDAETEADLAAIVDAATSVEEKVLLVGSAGLAMPYAMRAGVRRRRAVIVVSGTISAVTQAQLARLPADCNRIIVDPQMAVERGQRWRRWLGVVASAPLAEAASPIYVVTVGPRVIEAAHDTSLRIASALGEVTEVLLRTINCDGMIVSGGETANAVMAQLRAEGIDLTEELLPGIPTGLVVAGPYAGMRIVTKAGGFGEIDALVKAIAYLRGEREAS